MKIAAEFKDVLRIEGRFDFVFAGEDETLCAGTRHSLHRMGSDARGAFAIRRAGYAQSTGRADMRPFIPGRETIFA